MPKQAHVDREKESNTGEEKTVLVGLIQKDQTSEQVAEYLDELAFLAETAGAVAVKRFTQKLPIPIAAPLLEKENWKRSKNMFPAGILTL
jgi:GTP-binding protein HflX